MTPGAAIGVVLGLSLALFGPRAGKPLLVGAAAALATLATVAWASAGRWMFLAATVAWVAVLATAVWLVERRPRAGLLLGLLLALAFGVLPLRLGGLSTGATLTIAGVYTVIAGWGLVRPRFGVRFAMAAIGARVVLWSLPGTSAAWHWLLLTPLLLGLGLLTSRQVRLERARRSPALQKAGALAIAALTAAVLVVLLTPELCACQDRGSARMARLRQIAPRGGYLWPELSEAIIWEDAAGYRFWDNLDVRYLTGGADRGLQLLPGSSRLLGRFSLNREVDRMRAIKDAAELADLATAARAIVTAVRETAPGRTPGVTERSVAEAIQAQARVAGCTEDSFPPEVASGPPAAAIHAGVPGGRLEPGQLVVVDVGCSVNHYASDFTRTFPVGGRFTPEQRRLYQAVYAAQQAAAAACRPGAVISGKTAPDGSPSLDAIAHRVLREQTGEPGYNHGLGHGVGLFVHDVSTGGPLATGMVLTIEPGLYLPGKLGIRIEDTYRVTETGCEQLTTGLPADPDAVEAFLAGGAPK